MKDFFHKFASATSNAVGSPWAFMLAFAVVLAWVVTGPVFHFSDTWQLVINTGTTIVTFLMVFLIQNTQNRDSKAVNLKLDELIRALEGARTGLVDLEDLNDEDLARLQEQFQRLHERMGNKSIKADGDQLEAEEIKASKIKADRVEAKETITEQDDGTKESHEPV